MSDKPRKRKLNGTVTNNNAKTKRKSAVGIEQSENDESFDNEEPNAYNSDDEEVVDGIRIPAAIKPITSLDPNGPRLIITRIDNDFFKSYANGQVLGPFHKCFNAIVGPNGSGKSNVIDSMLFVFGYRATKIRSKKVSVLLHNSENFRNVQSCTVAVHFALINDKDGDEYEIIPGSEFVVSRTANKDNSSFYMLNDKRVQFKEIGKLLKKFGIDLDHNRFLILQGEVEQIAMMKCKGENENETGIIEYLEDIIGTSRYKVPLTELNERVDELSEQRNHKLNRLKLVQNELDELQGPKEEAVGFLQKENTIIVCKNLLYQKGIFDLEDELKVVDAENVEICEIQNGFVEKLTKLSEEKSQKESLLAKETAKYSTLEKRKESLKEAFDNANKKDIQLQETMTDVNKKRKKTKELLAEERKKLEKLKRVPEESKQGIIECEEKERKLSADKLKFEEEKSRVMADLGQETEGLQQEKEVIQTDLAVLKKAADDAKAHFSLAESELKICVSTEVNERNKLDMLKQSLDNCTKTLSERTEALTLLKKKIPATGNSLKSANDDLHHVKRQQGELVNTIKRKRSSLEESRSAMQASKSRGRVLDALMQEKSRGNCDGLFGRLGDLGAVDAKYDVAVSTACGPLDYIVVDKASTATWCIEYLKKHNIGRASFIALDKQEHLRGAAESKIKTPENVLRLFDLIKIQDERVRTAFYFGLRDTLVADDLEQASRISYGAQRFRVVTLKGELIETTGTMSGGGGRVLKGRIGRSVAVTNIDPRDVAEMETNLQELEHQFQQFQQRQTTLEDQIATLTPELQKMRIDEEKFTRELATLRQQQPELQKQLKEQEAKTKRTVADPKEKSRLEKVVEERKTSYERAAALVNELQVQVDRLTKEINDRTSGRLKPVEKKIRDARNLIEKLKADIVKMQVAVRTAERNSTKSAEKIATMEQDIKDMESRLLEMKSEREQIDEDAQKLLKCIDDLTVNLNEGQNTYSDLHKEVDELKKKENKLRLEKVDVDQKVKVVEKKMNEITSAMHHYNVKITQLKLHDIPKETVAPLKKFTREDVEEQDFEAVKREQQGAENHLKAAKPNLNAIQEYLDKEAVFIERSKELVAITEKRTLIRNLYEKLRNQRKDEFLTGYHIIKMKLKEMYQMITLEGDADFEMVDSFDPFTEGIQFNVRPPKKSWKNISNLSGGEKTLSSLALVFALHYYKPSPLYVMDEIDAALDFKNVSIVAHYIKERTKNAQFIIISLRSNMFELCDNLIGIYKTYNTTKSVTIDPRMYDKRQGEVETNNAQNDNVEVAVDMQNENVENQEEAVEEPVEQHDELFV